MALSYLDHFLIRPRDLDVARDWYVRVLGLRTGPAPSFRTRGCWLYLGERPVVHAMERAKTGDGSATRSHANGVIDHVSFRCTGLGETMRHLEAEGVPFDQRQVASQRLYQLFLSDPDGVRIELTFPAAEAEAEGLWADEPAHT